jgi:hypothetical protein
VDTISGQAVDETIRTRAELEAIKKDICAHFA